MSALVPARPKIYHIVHVDRLTSIVSEGALFSDATMRGRIQAGTTIGYDHIKERRLRRELRSRPGLRVGDCVPFYFCPRSPMLYTITQRSADLSYTGGDEPIVHLEADLRHVVDWAESVDLRWVFTDVSAATNYFEDFVDLSELNQIDWETVSAMWWSGRSAEKQAEFLVESEFDWALVDRIGCRSTLTFDRVVDVVEGRTPSIEIIPSWYYT